LLKMKASHIDMVVKFVDDIGFMITLHSQEPKTPTICCLLKDDLLSCVIGWFICIEDIQGGV
jgi:hypothetical protein